MEREDSGGEGDDAGDQVREGTQGEGFVFLINIQQYLSLRNTSLSTVYFFQPY